jgi:hypothetical protein
LNELVFAEQVRTRVTNLREKEEVIEECRGRDGRSHSVTRTVRSRFVVDANSRGFDCADEASCQVVTGIGSGAPGSEQSFEKDIDRELARDFSCGGSAHAIAHGEHGAARAER